MSIKVLVADDSVTIQKVIGIIFGGDEYALTVVDNGRTAVDKAREIIPDVLLIDALMPGMSGYEVSESVRSTPSLATKPILLMTGSFEPFDEEKAKQCGADDFIAKPFESQQIISKVHELLERGRSRALAAQASQPETAAESLRTQEPDASAPVFGTPDPTVSRQPDVPQQTAPADIWGAFTTVIEPAVEAAVPPAAASSAAAFGPDVFAIVTEESDSQPVQTSVTPGSSPLHTGSEWVPVEESTFEFEENVIATPPRTAFMEQSEPLQEASFGDITFEDDIAPPVAPTLSAVSEPDFTASAPAFPDATPPAPLFEEPPAAEPVPDVEILAQATPPSSVTLTEEQLRAAITSASKDVIERIVWEVVPDLAEALILEAIRKIKAGV